MNWWLLAVGWLFFYGLLFAYYRVRPTPPGVSFSGPITMWRAQTGLSTLQALTAWKQRFWNVWGGIGLGVTLVGMVLGTVLILSGAYRTLTTPQAASLIDSPRNYLVIPGVNDFLPLEAAPELVLGLLIGMVIHEAGHAIMCYLYDIEVESTGLFFFLALPMGAFVEPNEESQARADKLDRLRMFAGGIMNNVVFSIIALMLLFGPVLGAISVAPGAPVGAVMPYSPADTAGLDDGDRITAIEGTPIETAADLDAALAESSADSVTLEVNGADTVTVDRYVFLTAVPDGAPDSVELGDRVVAVDGDPVTSADAFHAALSETDGTVDVELADGTMVVFDAGIQAVASPSGGAADAGLPTDEPFSITAVDGTPVYTTGMLSNELSAYDGGESVTLTVVVDGEQRTTDVVLSDEGLIGVHLGTGPSDVGVADFGVEYYPADQYLTALQSGTNSVSAFLVATGLLLFLPLMSLNPGSLFDFPGFVGSLQNFFVVEGVAGGVPGAWFFVASVLFWSAWLNINLALFNCIPTFALDGGHIWRDMLYVIGEKVPGIDPEGPVVRCLSTGMLVLTLMALAVMILYPIL